MAASRVVIGAGCGAEFDAVHSVRASGPVLERGQIEDEEGVGWVGGVGNGGDDPGDDEFDAAFVDEEGKGAAGCEPVASGAGLRDEDRMGIGEGGPEQVERVCGGSVGGTVGGGIGRAGLAEPGTVASAGSGVLDRDEVDAEEREGGAFAQGFVLALARHGGGRFEDREDLDGLGAEGGAEVGEDGVGEIAGGRGDDPVGFLGDEFGEVLEAGDGGAVGESDGEVDSDAEGDDEDEQGRLAGLVPPVAQGRPREEESERGRVHGAAVHAGLVSSRSMRPSRRWITR